MDTLSTSSFKRNIWKDEIDSIYQKKKKKPQKNKEFLEFLGFYLDPFLTESPLWFYYFPQTGEQQRQKFPIQYQVRFSVPLFILFYFILFYFIFLEFIPPLRPNWKKQFISIALLFLTIWSQLLTVFHLTFYAFRLFSLYLLSIYYEPGTVLGCNTEDTGKVYGLHGWQQDCISFPPAAASLHG